MLDALRVIGRFFSGRDLDGNHRTNAQFTIAGNRSIHAWIQKPSKWALLPGYQRAGYRIGVTVVLVAALIAYLAVRTRYVMPASMFAVVYWILQIAALAAVILVYRGIKTWYHQHTYVQPLHDALAPLLGLEPFYDPSYITVPRDFHDDLDKHIVIQLPTFYAPIDQTNDKIIKTIEARLGIEAEPQWRLKGNAPTLLVQQAPQPPDRVTLKMVEDAMMEKTFSPVLGMGTRDRIVRWDLDKNEAVNMLLSARIGRGKTALTRLQMCQWLAMGGRVVLFDIKRISHAWAKGLPGILYCRHPQEIHTACLAMESECDRRYDLIDEHGDAVAFTPILVVCEEMNATMYRVQEWWQSIRESSDPKRATSLTAFNNVVFIGRQARFHTIGVAQMGTARASGGNEMRENFDTRFLMAYTMNVWKMLGDPTMQPPPPSQHPGRGIKFHDNTITKTQVAFVTDSQARDWALQHMLALGIPNEPDISITDVLTRPGIEPVLQLTPETRTEPKQPPEIATLTLREAVDGPLKGLISLDALRKASQRDTEFPHVVKKANGVASEYAEDELERWARNRTKALPVAKEEAKLGA